MGDCCVIYRPEPVVEVEQPMQPDPDSQGAQDSTDLARGQPKGPEEKEAEQG